MTVQESRIIYILEAGAALVEKTRNTTTCWADGDENLCLTFEDALEVPELADALKGREGGCDVIVSQ